MTYLELVQKAMNMAKVRSAVPTTLVGVTGVAEDFKDYVADAWRELQEESLNWWFRQKLDQTFAVTTGLDEYSMPTNLQTINFRTASVYQVAKTDEYLLRHMEYEYWRAIKDTVESKPGRPEFLIERPDGVLQIWPVPAEAYTFRYDGVYDIDEMLLDSDTPGYNIAGEQTLPTRNHWLLVYDAARRYYESIEDGEGVERMQSKFLAQHARLAERHRPEFYIKPGRLTGWVGRERRYW
jgi:hypothetical protein